MVLNIAFSKDGKTMATLSRDRIICLFNFLTGKIQKQIDETLDAYSAIQQVIILHFRFLLLASNKEKLLFFFHLRLRNNLETWSLDDVLPSRKTSNETRHTFILT